MRGLPIALREAPLALTYSEAAQPLDIFRCVTAPPVRISPRQRYCAKALTKPQPSRRYAELVGRFADRERVSINKHAPTLGLADRFD